MGGATILSGVRWRPREFLASMSGFFRFDCMYGLVPIVAQAATIEQLIEE